MRILIEARRVGIQSGIGDRKKLVSVCSNRRGSLIVFRKIDPTKLILPIFIPKKIEDNLKEICVILSEDNLLS